MASSALEPVLGLGPARRQAQTLGVADHRPWAVPDRPWVMGQTWVDLLFAHWPVDAAALRRVVPEPLELDELAGSAWIGITPFVVRALRPRLLPPLPAGSRFAELNVRTYVTFGGKPGIWFLSLDAASRVVVFAARRAYRLPYFHAHMTVQRTGREIAYRSERAAGASPPEQLRARYAPSGGVFTARPGALEHFLTERYCLYTVDVGRRVHRTDIHHPPWPLQPARATFEANTMTAAAGLAPGEEPLLHFAGRQDVVVWPPVAVG
jgi:uncharacterized protein YqjF (DUF2071 family)